MKEGRKEDEPGLLELGHIGNQETDGENPEQDDSARDDDKEEKGNFFSLKASILALWVPCVVGKTKYSFPVISLASFTARTLAFLLAFLLAQLRIVPSGTFILYCVPHLEHITSRGNTSIITCHTISDCFDTKAIITDQKVRLCDETDQDFVLIIFGICVIVAGIFSVIGTFFLHKMASYEHLFDVSNNCCWLSECPLFPCCLNSLLSPIIHRRKE